MSKIKSSLINNFKALFWALIIAGVIRTFAIEPFKIPSGSMKPNLLVGDFLFVSKWDYGYSRYSFPFGIPPFKGKIFESNPERGDVIVFKLPGQENINYVKRLIGPLDYTPEYQIPKDKFFFMGDNRDNSSDSRVLSGVGFVPKVNIIGKVWFIWFSVDTDFSISKFWNLPLHIRYDRLFNIIK